MTLQVKLTKLHFRRVGNRILQKGVRKGTHGQQIRCLAIRPSRKSTVLLASGSEDTYINFTQGMAPAPWIANEVRHDSLEPVDRKKQYNTGVQALVFSPDGKVLFSSAGQKEVSVSPFRVGGKDIISVEFGGYSSVTRTEDTERDDNSGGDLRIMGIDVRDQTVCNEHVYLVSLVLSDSTIKVNPGK